MLWLWSPLVMSGQSNFLITGGWITLQQFAQVQPAGERKVAASVPALWGYAIHSGLYGAVPYQG